MGESEDYRPPATCFKSGDAESGRPAFDVVNGQPLIDYMTNQFGTPGMDRTALSLIQLGRNLENYDFCFEPVLVSMVEVILTGIGGLCDAEMGKLRASVASSLYDNTQSRERLQRLWEQLKSSDHRIS